MSKAVGRPLCREIQFRSACIDFPAAADPYRYTGERRSGEAKDVGRHLGGMYDRDVTFAAPPAEPHEMPCDMDVPEACDRKSAYRGGRLGRALEPGPRLLETCEMHEPATPIQPPQQLDHLAFGAAWLEAAQKESYRDRAGGAHA
jgi:hypothetical protein